MFGDGFMYVAEEEKDRLCEGDYYGSITNVIDNPQLQNAINVCFKIQGHPDCTPFCMTLFARPVIGQSKANGTAITEEDTKKWDKTMSRFFDAFGINKGDFNFNNWKGHKAWLTCKKNKNNEYSSLYIAFDQHKEKAPAQVEKVAAAVGGTAVKTPAFAPSNHENYPEEIPF